MSRRLAATSVVAAISLALATSVETARRPRYGGTLRVEIGAVLSSLDPAAAVANGGEAAAKAEIDSLIYDTRDADGGFSGAGAFHVTALEAGRRAVLSATEDYRLGRPFVDSVEIIMGRAAHDRMVDLELNKADFAEVPAEDARKAAERGVRISRSQPDELLALIFLPGRAAVENARAREAVVKSIDRAAIVNFILQKEGEAAASLLPQWSSGTAFLFPTAADPAHAKELWTQISPAPKLVLGYDFGDSLEQAVAERIAVNGREAGIALTAQAIRTSSASGLPRQGVPEVDARLVRLRMVSPKPGVALENFMDRLGTMTRIDAVALPGQASAEDIYNREHAIAGSYRVAPLVWLPQVYGLSARVRNWTAPGAGEPWPLADVWLDGPAEAASEEGKQ